MRGSGPSLVIGLTGAIAAGKSAAAQALRDLGVAVFDADAEVSRLLGEPEVLERIAQEVDPAALVGGSLDRSALARVVFEDEAKRRALERILHPPVLAAARAMAAGSTSGPGAVALDVPLLFEAGLEDACDEVWFIDAPREAREARVREHRGWGPGELARREAAQMPLEEKRERADRLIVNAGSRAALEREVRRALEAARRGRGVT